MQSPEAVDGALTPGSTPFTKPVYVVEDFLKKASNPPAEAEVKYGDRFEHCWNGDPNVPNYISRLRYNTMYVEKILGRIERSAPAGADVRSWRH